MSSRSGSDFVATRWAGLLAALLMILGLGAPGQVVDAQGGTGVVWSTPQNLSNTSGDSNSPAIAADASGSVHVFWAENLDESLGYPVAILYTRWDGSDWSKPVDVLISPEGPQSGADAPSVVASPDGRLHLVWLSGFRDRVYYSSAWVGDAVSAQAWDEAIQLNQDDVGGGAPEIALGPEGNLYVVYAVGTGADQAVYFVSSVDGGQHWSSPAAIPESRLGPATVLSDVRIAVAPDGAIQVVWISMNYPTTFPPQTDMYYARSLDSGLTWSEPFLVADGPFESAAVAAAGQSEVHIVWSGSGTIELRSKFHRWSADGGLTWSSPVAVLHPGGLQGYADMAVDSAGTVHWATVTSYTDVSDPLAHLQWNGSSWLGPDLLLTSWNGPNQPQNCMNSALAVSQGNLLHVVVACPIPARTAQGYQMDILYVGGLAAAPQVPPKPLPTRTPAATSTPASMVPGGTVPAALPGAVAPTATPGFVTQQQRKTANAGPTGAFLAGLAPLLVLLAAVILVRLRHRGLP